MVAAVPLAKLGGLILKQVSKPIATLVKTNAKNHPVFRKYVCLPPAKLYNWCELKIKMWMLAMGHPVNITVLTEEKAIELGSDLVGEGIIFMIAAAILLSEYNRSSRKEAAKEAEKKRELEELQRAIRDLYIENETQRTQIRELLRKVIDLETTVVQLPFSVKKKKPLPEETPRPPIPFSNLDKSDDDASQGESEVKQISNINHKPQIKLLNNEYQECDNLIFRALSDIEKNFLIDPNPPKKEGILTIALDMLYRDVFNISIKF